MATTHRPLRGEKRQSGPFPKKRARPVRGRPKKIHILCIFILTACISVPILGPHVCLPPPWPLARCRPGVRCRFGRSAGVAFRPLCRAQVPRYKLPQESDKNDDAEIFSDTIGHFRTQSDIFGHNRTLSWEEWAISYSFLRKYRHFARQSLNPHSPPSDISGHFWAIAAFCEILSAFFEPYRPLASAPPRGQKGSNYHLARQSCPTVREGMGGRRGGGPACASPRWNTMEHLSALRCSKVFHCVPLCSTKNLPKPPWRAKNAGLARWNTHPPVKVFHSVPSICGCESSLEVEMTRSTPCQRGMAVSATWATENWRDARAAPRQSTCFGGSHPRYPGNRLRFGASLR